MFSLYLHCQIFKWDTYVFPLFLLKRLYIYIYGTLMFSLYLHCQIFKWNTYVSLCFFEALIYIYGTLMFPFISIVRFLKWDTYVSLCFFEALIYIYIWDTYVSLYLHCQIFKMGHLCFPFVSLKRLYIYMCKNSCSKTMYCIYHRSAR